MNDDIIKLTTKQSKKRSSVVAKEIRFFINNLFMKSKVKDATLFDRSIIISDVVVSNDLSHAKVYILPTITDNNDEIIIALNNNASFFRYNLGKYLRTKTIPQLSFYLDDELKRIKDVDDMFSKISKKSESF